MIFLIKMSDLENPRINILSMTIVNDFLSSVVVIVVGERVFFLPVPVI